MQKHPYAIGIFDQRSVERRSGEVELPGNFSDELVVEGAHHYTESCVCCQGAPGQDPVDWSRGMRPEPPHLTEAAADRSAKETYWRPTGGAPAEEATGDAAAELAAPAD